MARAARFLGAGIMALAMASALPAAAQTDALADAFKGKTVSVLVGFGPGGANDVWARSLARYMGKHWPGNPTVVVQNQPGAGGLTLMNQLYAVSPKDGSVIGLVSRGIPLEPLLGGQGTQFDPQRMTWIGSPDRDITVCAARKDAAVQTMADLFKTELVVGATGSGADTAIYPEFLSELLGMKFKTVKGYKGSNDIILAMERGEVQGICFAYDSLMRTPIAKEGRVNVLFQAAMKADPKLKDIPVGLDGRPLSSTESGLPEVAALRIAIETASAERERHEQRLTTLLKVSGRLIEAGHRDELGRIVFEEVAPLFDADVCLKYGFKSSHNLLELAFSQGVPIAELDAFCSLAVPEALCGLVADKLSPVTVDAREIALDPRAELLHRLGVGAYSCHLLRARYGRTFGTFALASRKREQFSTAKSRSSPRLQTCWLRPSSVRLLRHRCKAHTTPSATSSTSLRSASTRSMQIFVSIEFRQVLKKSLLRLIH